MAIFGTFHDMPLPDVLSMVGRSSGKFYITDLPHPVNYELHLFEGALIALYINSLPLEEVLDVGHSMVELMRARTGQFRFERSQPHDLMEYFRLPVDQVLLSSLATADEIDAMRPFLPNEKTVFVVSTQTEKWMDDDLQYFYELSRPLLKDGASGEYIASRTGQYLDQVLFSLYKLRTAGLIVPFRPIVAHASRAIRAASQRIALPIAGAAATVTATVVASASTPPPAVAEYRSSDLRDVNIRRPERSLFARMMSHLGAALSSLRA